MNAANRDFLDKNRHHYDTVIKAGYVRHLNVHEREGMQRVMREEFRPGYHTDLWCGPCVFDMVKLLYQHYDAWLAAQPKEETLTNISASFPSNKSNELHTPNGHNRPQRRNRR